jgi:hypothetical protein
MTPASGHSPQPTASRLNSSSNYAGRAEEPRPIGPAVLLPELLELAPLPTRQELNHDLAFLRNHDGMFDTTFWG